MPVPSPLVLLQAMLFDDHTGKFRVVVDDLAVPGGIPIGDGIAIIGHAGDVVLVLVDLAKKIGEETYFHLKYATGWMQIIGEGKKEAERFVRDFDKRYKLALQWFGPANADDPVHKAGLRDVPVTKLREAFVREVAKAKDAVGASVKVPKTVKMPKDWRADARRLGALPEGLFEIVRFKDPSLAH